MQKTRFVCIYTLFWFDVSLFSIDNLIFSQILGRLASQISTVLQGKDKPTYTPYREDGDMCIVLNAKDIHVTGRKLTDKFYRWHTGQV